MNMSIIAIARNYQVQQKKSLDLSNQPEAVAGLADMLRKNPQLKELLASHNRLTAFPVALLSLAPWLQRLNLSHNLMLTLPSMIGQGNSLNDLRELNLSANPSLVLSESIGFLKRLETLKVDGNSLKSLPDAIGKLKKLKELDVSKNMLLCLPDSIGNLSKLTELNAQENALASVPAGLFCLKKLKVLNLAKNKLTHLPHFPPGSDHGSCVARMKALAHLQLDHNLLTKLPKGICTLPRLQELECDNNLLNELPAELGPPGAFCVSGSTLANSTAPCAHGASGDGKPRLLTDLKILKLHRNRLPLSALPHQHPFWRLPRTGRTCDLPDLILLPPTAGGDEWWNDPQPPARGSPHTCGSGASSGVTVVRGGALWLGSEHGVQQSLGGGWDFIAAHGITHVLSVISDHGRDSTGAPAVPKGVVQMHIDVPDAAATDLKSHWARTVPFIHKARQAGGGVLVHCRMGVSRSSSCVLSYMLWLHAKAFLNNKTHGGSGGSGDGGRGMDGVLALALAHAIARRPRVKPNTGFMKQLQEYSQSLIPALHPSAPQTTVAAPTTLMPPPVPPQ